MKTRQFMVLVMAGVLSMSSAPMTAWAEEEAAVAAEEASETEAAEESADASLTEEAADSGSESEETPDASADTNNTADGAADSGTDSSGEEAEVTPTNSEEETTENTDPSAEEEASAEETETQTDTGYAIYDANGAAVYYNSLQEAVDAASSQSLEQGSEVTVVLTGAKAASDSSDTESNPYIISQTITLTAGKVCIRSAASDVTIKRDTAAPFLDAMFAVSGSETVLEFDVAEPSDAVTSTLTINGEVDENTKADGSIVTVSDQAVFGLNDGVTLTGNNIGTGNGAAIKNTKGRVILSGGTISGNMGAGAVYTDADIYVLGNPVVSDNLTETGSAQNNLYLDNDAKILIAGEMESSSKIGVSANNSEDAKEIAKIGSIDDNVATQDQFKAAVSYFTSDDSGYKIVLNSDSTQYILQTTSVDTKSMNVSMSKNSYSWSDHYTLNAGNFQVNKKSNVKWFVVGASATEADIKTKASTTKATKSNSKTVEANKDFTVKYTFPNEDKDADYKLIIWAEDAEDSSNTDYYAYDLYVKSKTSAVMKKRPWALSNKSFAWKDRGTITFKGASTANTYYGAFVTDASISSSELNKLCNADYKKVKGTSKSHVNNTSDSFTVTVNGYVKHDLGDTGSPTSLSKIDSLSDKIIIFWGVPTSGGSAKVSKISFKDEFVKKRPASAAELTKSANADREAYTYTVDDNTITGLEDALKFFPFYYYNFEVKEAGMDNESPIVGDQRWSYMYWSTSSNPTTEQQQTKKAIGLSNTKGKEAFTANVYVFFKKQQFNGSEWVDTGETASKRVTITSAGYTDEEYKEFLKKVDDTDPNYTPSTEYAAELTQAADEEATDKETDSTSKAAASTGDESPVGSMSALAMMSLLAGGYVLIRKRKKEN